MVGGRGGGGGGGVGGGGGDDVVGILLSLRNYLRQTLNFV